MAENEQSARGELLRNYEALIAKITPKSELGAGILRAFWVGGVICMLGQAIAEIAEGNFNMTASAALTMASVTLVFLAALLTGIGIFDNIALYAGAGTLVPITGFANAMVSPAMEFRPEGWVLGTGAKLFAIAGPVIAYGVATSVIVGILYFFIRW